MFAIFSFAISPMIYLFYPETANRTLEDMDQIFIHNPSAFVFANKVAIQSGRPQAYVDAEALRIAQAEDESRGTSLERIEKPAGPLESFVEV